jgi:NAD(P)-dependent dehydrogenase (short-subunit alcohol dehydrogenase family)
MADKFKVGQTVLAEYEGEWYKGEILEISESKKRAKAPIKVRFIEFGEEDDSWLPTKSVRPSNVASAAGHVDYSGLTVGAKVQVEADGVYYTAEVLDVNTKKTKAPVKVHFLGYTADSDEWVGADRMRSKLLTKKTTRSSTEKAKRPVRAQQFSLADQVARFERAKKEKNDRYLNISSVYDGSAMKGKRVLLVGASRGLGLEIAKELIKQDAEMILTCRKSNAILDSIGAKQLIQDVEVTDLASMTKMAEQITGSIDYLIFNAGYFPDITDNLTVPNAEEALKQIDICALGPYRCVAALKQKELLSGSKIIIITSQAGSAKWRFTQNKDKGGDYGHHMSRAACNIGGVLMCEELKAEGVPVVMLHPGFNRTDMTSKFSHIWDVEGAVTPAEGAMRVIYEACKVTMKTSGKFINCEDGLQIPF